LNVRTEGAEHRPLGHPSASQICAAAWLSSPSTVRLSRIDQSTESPMNPQAATPYGKSLVDLALMPCNAA
jgi:hypothetical protein